MTVIIYGTTTLTPWQVQLASGAIVGAGSGINLSTIGGLRDLPAIRVNDQERGQDDGAYPGTSYLGERVVPIQWELTLATGMETALQTLAAGYQNVTDPDTVVMTGGAYLEQHAGVANVGLPLSAIQIQLPGRAYPFVVFGRPSKYTVPINTAYQWGQVQVSTEWTSPDGLLYDGSIASASTGLPTPTTGLSWPAAFPWSFGASTGGLITLNNTGGYRTSPLIVIQGPVSFPRVTNTNTGEYMDYNIVLASTDTLVINHQTGVVTLNGSANRNNIVNVGSTFYTMAPGNTSLTFSSKDAAAVAGTMTAYIMPAYSTA